MILMGIKVLPEEVYVPADEYCPCCPKSCSPDALQCGKGRAYFEKVKNPASAEEAHHPHGDFRHRREEGAPHHRCGKGGRDGREVFFPLPSDMETLEIHERLAVQFRFCAKFLHHCFGGRSAQDRILMLLEKRECMGQSELLRMLDMRSSSLSELLDKLAEQGFIRQTKNERDRRSVELSLTEEGRMRAERLSETRTAHIRAVYDLLDEEEKERLSALLAKLIAGWNEGQFMPCHKGLRAGH